MTEAVTDIIVARSQEVDRLSRMFVWSVAAHIAVVAAMVVFQSTRPEPAPRTIMTISLGGAVGPRTAGQNQIGGRPVQAPEPEAPIRRAETAPAPIEPPMTLPAPQPRPRRQPPPKPEQAPREATSRTPTTGPEPREGSTRSDTQNRGTGFGLSSAGGVGGGSVTLDVSDFCCQEYIGEMVERIQRYWNPRESTVGTTTMKFVITRDGTITAIQRERSSGFQVLDQQAERALYATRQLPPLPQQYSNQTLTVHLEFVHQR